MTVYYQDEWVTLYHGDCRDALATMPDASVDAVVTDPPYELGFMGKEWDASGIAYNVDLWRDALRVLKPGGHMLAFGGSRTWHRLASAVEDAGFEIRDSIAWLNSQGFPKSHNLDGDWQGWGTALKPAFEPIVVGRKPLAGTVAANVLQYGTGALNIDGCRIESDRGEQSYTVTRWKPGAELSRDGGTWKREDENAPTVSGTLPSGRWPANVVLDESQAAALNRQAGPSRPAGNKAPLRSNRSSGMFALAPGEHGLHPAMQDGDDDRVSRFFPTFRYQPKAPQSERPKIDGVQHVTVKPLDLMRWLVRLVTPPGGTVLEPFAGSGTTAEACIAEGFRCIAIEREADYLPLIRQRLDKPIQVALDLGGVS